MDDIDSLPHVSTLPNIESNFKVFAGPGAGKTTWLTSHLEKVLAESTRLNKTRKIACITYTNVAAEEIITRLNCDVSRFDISTIHSFLYRNIVKPFSYLIEKDEDDEILFDTSKLDGHDEHIVHGDRLRRWIASIGQLNNRNYNIYNSNQNKPKVVAELASLDYEFQKDEIDLIIRQNRGARLPKSNRELWLYKSKYWKDGIMHHEDVLYFSYLILSKSPRIVEFIRNKFPYIFIDEFQDTTDVQTWIIDLITASESKVGIVGDLAQSIYKFTGAKRTDFLDFKNGDALNFKLSHNHRSTRRIVSFLNSLRPDINQEYNENSELGSPVKVLIGTIQSSISWYETSFNSSTLYILTRNNNTVSEINSQLGVGNTNLLKELYTNDSNAKRARFIHAVLMSCKFRMKGDLKNALDALIKPLRRASGNKILKLSLRSIAIGIIDSLKIEENINKSIFDYYTDLRGSIREGYGFDIGSGFRAGQAKAFYETNTIINILPFIKVDTKTEDFIRTFHSTKGTEFDNVLVHFETTNEFNKYIINGSNYIDIEKDDCRIYYVGCSRAKSNLLINIPEATQEDIEAIESMNMEYERI